MKAMILAAGRGERMRPLTDTLPKPLLPVDGEPLIVHHLKRLAAVGITEIVINISYRAEQIKAFLGKGAAWGVNIAYSYEPHALETGGGILHALPLLGEAPFIVVNGDVWTDYPFQQLLKKNVLLAHLILVNNPAHHPEGDFYLSNGIIVSSGKKQLTYSGIGVFHPQLFKNCQPGAFKLAPLLFQQLNSGKISGDYYNGIWQDIGTVERLQLLNLKNPEQ